LRGDANQFKPFRNYALLSRQARVDHFPPTFISLHNTDDDDDDDDNNNGDEKANNKKKQKKIELSFDFSAISYRNVV
jgi:hypothetical protein